MTLPSREELMEAVDLEFREQHPSAPERLDEHDASQAHYVAAWVAIRDRKANEWTDEIFDSFFPDAGRLDPNNPRDSTLVDYWLDIRNQLRDGPPGKYDWSSFAPTSAALYRQTPDGEPDPVIPDPTDALASIHRARDVLVDIVAGTDLATRVSEHIDRQVGELVRANGEGGLGNGQQWKSQPLTASVPDPDGSDLPFYVRDITVVARLDDTTFTLVGGVTGSARGPNGTIEP